MKNLAGQEVGIEVGMVFRSNNVIFRHVRYVGVDRIFCGEAFNSIANAINSLDGVGWAKHEYNNWICVGYHNPLGEDKNGEVIHYGDKIMLPTGDFYRVIGELKHFFLLDENNDFEYCRKDMCFIKEKNPLRTQSEKTPEQIAKEKWIADGEGKGWFRDGKVIV